MSSKKRTFHCLAKGGEKGDLHFEFSEYRSDEIVTKWESVGRLAECEPIGCCLPGDGRATQGTHLEMYGAGCKGPEERVLQEEHGRGESKLRRQQMKAILDDYGLKNAFTLRTVGFSDLMRKDKQLVTIKNWTPSVIALTIKDRVWKEYQVLVQFE